MSKPGVEAAVCLGFSSGEACRNCRKEAAEGVEVGVEAMSKRANFDN